MKDIRLYIANKLVDCTDGISLPMNYQLEDFSNPTLVKNSFSKTIAIPGTKNNNKIFGEIYKLDRMQHYEEWTGNPELNGINFDPSKRVEFQIYKDADLVESGYMQLNDISIQENNITYNITLYGGIGDFFYGLKYKEDGTEKTLADLRFFVEDNNGNVLPEDEELDFEVDKDLVAQSFEKDYNYGGNKLLDYITFIPAYNGIYEDFDSSKCLINTNGSQSGIFPTSKEDGGRTYTTLNGYGLASLDRDYTEWEMRDLRSYHQRPAIKVSKLIETICRQENSGYNVTYDSSFFNANNPYWSKSFVALPLLTSNQEEEDEQEDLTTNISLLNGSNVWIGNKNDTKRSSTSGDISISLDNVTVDNNGVITIVDWDENTRLNISANYRFWAHTPNAPIADVSILYCGWGVNMAGVAGYYQAYSTYLTVVDADTDEVLGYSTVNQMEDPTWSSRISDIKPFTNASVIRKKGWFRRSAVRDYYFEESTGGNSTFNLKINNCRTSRRIKIKFNIGVTLYADESQHRGAFLLADDRNFNPHYITIYYGDPTFVSGTASIGESGENPNAFRFTKEKFLKTEQSPADFLLNYSKLFGLYFIKDRYNKSIFICTRNTFFNGQINNWSSKIDYLKDVTITPILFDKKFYLMQLDTPETKDALRYKSQYSQQYGQQRLSTGYNFNYDSDNFYDENIYQQIIPTIDSDRFFRTFYTSDDDYAPAWLLDNASYELFNGTESTTIDLYGRNIIDPTKTVEWTNKGKDVWAKSCFFNLDNDEKNLVEIESALLIWNGVKPLEDSAGNPIYFWITDDLPEMGDLNDGDPCFLFTESEYDASQTRIAVRVDELPQYLNCLIDSSSNVTHSFDFGLPKEIYMGNMNYSQDVTLYANFWRAFYNDQFNIDTKKVTCFVKLDDMNQDYLREFYFFDNAIWILNKVDSYDINSDATVRCEFVKVQDINNYTNGVTRF